MKTYKVPGLSTKTPQTEQNKLIAALKAVGGVQGALLRPEANSFEITGKNDQTPKREAVASAVTSAGFKLADN